MFKHLLFVAPFVLALVACGGASGDDAGSGVGEMNQKKQEPAKQDPAAKEGKAAADKEQQGKAAADKEQAKDTEEGKICGGEKDIRCAKGYTCLLEPAREGEVSSGTCIKDDGEEEGESNDVSSDTLCTPKANVFCRCNDAS